MRGERGCYVGGGLVIGMGRGGGSGFAWTEVSTCLGVDRNQGSTLQMKYKGGLKIMGWHGVRGAWNRHEIKRCMPLHGELWIGMN